MRIAIVSVIEEVISKLYELLRNVPSVNLTYIVDIYAHLITLDSGYLIPFSFNILISFDELEALRFSVLVRPKGYILVFRRKERENLIPPYDVYPREELIVGSLSELYNVKLVDISSDDSCIAYTIGLVAAFKNLDMAYFSKVSNYDVLEQGYRLARALLHEIE